MNHGLTQTDTTPPKAHEAWRCSVCSSVFHRIDHYKRHLDTHTRDKPYKCIFCEAPFKRGDVLRRHWKTCAVRKESGRAIPDPRPGGKGKKACDSCAGLKKSCSGELPCVECQSRQKQCTYQRLSESHEPDSRVRRAGCPSADDDYEKPIEEDSQGHNAKQWNLGLQTLLPPVHAWYRAHSRST
ncbi:uncharacterized protein BDW47DRAFT_22263 [Aspergillus candidus]|uniref:C2H2-type domain-containing protein n=1 Tax=Aspergillus candidus TaxID=41067 RepID=A0A2I2FDI6_ASPCN|nr:hypothetical protein BDW47DRAFT_22263 [Aspergillus candidus]PLB38706.1 hypothetical protein BDW47DRAFT_22263 [Aspergillus candidus]